MYRRIELINHYNHDCKADYHHQDADGCTCGDYIGGIMNVSTEPVVNAWIDKLRGPSKGIPRNARFYFTEKGWKEVGRNVITACISSGQDYRVIKVKENAVHVIWRDDYTGYEVAAQPLKEKR